MRKPIEIRQAHFPGRAPIDSYGNGGFRFAEMSHRGSLLMLPSGIYGWDMAEGDPLTAENFQRVLEEAADIEVLLVGTGKDIRPLPAALRGKVQGERDFVRSDEHGRCHPEPTISCLPKNAPSPPPSLSSERTMPENTNPVPQPAYDFSLAALRD